MTRVLCLAEGDPVHGLSPASRFRVYQLLPALAAEGLDVDVRPSRPAKYEMGRGRWTKTPARRAFSRRAVVAAAALMALNRLPEIWSAEHYDAVWLQRDLLPFRTVSPVLETALVRRNPRIVFDFDDSIFTTQDPRAATRPVSGWLRDRDKIGHIIAQCAHVIAGNEYLASYARRWNPRVTVVPTVVDTDVYRPRDGARPALPVTIGWSGTHGNLPYLARLLPVLRRLASEDRVRLRVISSAHALALETGGLEVVYNEWRLDREIDDLQSFDIGLMPLPDDEWTKGKCGAKALQYMACGVPCVLSPVGVNAEIVQHGVHGFAATCDDEWLSALRTLVRDAELRRHMGEAARARIVADYSVGRWAPEVAAILRRVSAGGAG